MPKYFVNPFAVNGDREAIPDATDPNGFVSYDTGWGFDYERDPDPSVDPLTKDIEREKTNSLMFDITDNIKHFQDFGAPEWSSVRAANGGYPRDARVTMASVIYVSIVNANASTPGASATWVQSGQTDPTIISIAALTMPPNSFIWFSATDEAQVTPITSSGRTFLTKSLASQQREAIGVLPADTTLAGLVEYATDAEVNSGAANRVPEARQLRLGFAISTGNPSYIKFPTWLGGWIFGSGTASALANSVTTVNLTGIVPTAIRGVSATWAVGTNTDQRSIYASRSGRNIQLQNPDGSTATVEYMFMGN